jgi:indole-3-glycerol phosphate synthase
MKKIQADEKHKGSPLGSPDSYRDRGAHILDEITGFKRQLLEHKKKVVKLKELESRPLFSRACFKLTEFLSNSAFGIIAEHKRRSPSKPHLNFKTDVFNVAKGYQEAGVSGISVLTEQKYFGGSLEDLLLARASVEIPLLRKDFMVDEYQIIESKAHGADVILLIAACLTPQEVKSFSSLARQLGMQSILEVHNQSELEDYVCDSVDVIGVNNRNLKTFEVNLETSYNLLELIPKEFLKLSESGISKTEEIIKLKQAGFDGFLLGETFMKTKDPGAKAKEFISKLKREI